MRESFTGAFCFPAASTTIPRCWAARSRSTELNAYLLRIRQFRNVELSPHVTRQTEVLGAADYRESLVADPSHEAGHQGHVVCSTDDVQTTFLRRSLADEESSHDG